MEIETLEDKLLKNNCDPISLSTFTNPVTLPNGQTYDLVNILKLYRLEHGNLEGNEIITDPLTRKKVEIKPNKLCINITILNTLDLKAKSIVQYINGFPKNSLKFLFLILLEPSLAGINAI